MIKIVDVGKTIPDSYHGTDIDSAKLISSEKKFIPSKDRDDYLGYGIYFFEASRWHAEKWADRKAKKLGFKAIGIIKAHIKLGKCLDLNNYEHKKYLKDVARKFQDLGAADINDAVVINFFAAQVPIETVRATYVVPGYGDKALQGKMFVGSKFYDYSALMICVRDPNAISNISLCYTGVVV